MTTFVEPTFPVLLSRLPSKRWSWNTLSRWFLPFVKMQEFSMAPDSTQTNLRVCFSAPNWRAPLVLRRGRPARWRPIIFQMSCKWKRGSSMGGGGEGGEGEWTTTTKQFVVHGFPRQAQRR